MPNIAAVLKTEIARLARRELRQQTQAQIKTSREQRKQISSLEREVAELQRALRKLQTSSSPPERAQAREDGDGKEGALRWRADGFAKLRQRLGLTAQQMATLVGCSALSIYKWESGKVRPRPAQMVAIARVRALSKSAAQQELQAGGPRA